MTTTITPPAPASPKALPPRLLEPLQMVSARDRVLSVLLATFQWTVLAASAWLLIVLLLGGIREINILLAIVLAFAAWAVLIVGFHRLFVKRYHLFRKRNLTAAARLVDAAVPATQERISSAIELAEETETHFKGSPELVAHLTRQAEKDAASLDPATVVSGRLVFRWFLLVVPVALLWFGFAVTKGSTMALGLQRTLQPWFIAPPPPKATLTLEPGNITLAQGEPLTIKLTVTPLGKSTDVTRATLTRRSAEPGASFGTLTTDMKPTGPRTFSAFIPSVDQSFTYHASALDSKSPPYTVTVQSRPAFKSVSVTYEYPRYTKMATRTETSSDAATAGTIDALVGTSVRITADMNQPLKSASIDIADNSPNPGTLRMTPVEGKPTQYVTDLVVTKTTSYRFNFVSLHDVASKEISPRPIVARADNPPSIAITNPAPSAQPLKVRPDDVVPIHFVTSDDFGLSRVESLAQVEDASVRSQPLALPRGKGEMPLKEWNGKHDLSISEVLHGAPAGTKRVTVQLRATDNRDPGTQSATSSRLLLEIDPRISPLAQRQDAQAISDLSQAQKQAAQDLKEAEQKLTEAQTFAEKSPEAAAKELAEAQKKIAAAKQSLEKAAEKTSDSRLSDAAKDAKEIANKPLTSAQNHAAEAQIADKPDDRAAKLKQTQGDVADARKKLDELGKKLGDKSQDLPVAQEMDRLAKEKRQLADAQAKNPNDPANEQKKRELDKRMDQLAKDHPELQQSPAGSHQKDVEDLQKKLQEQQQKAAEAAKNGGQAQPSPSELQDQARKLGEKLDKRMKDGHPPKDRNDPDMQQARKVAEEVKRQAEQLSQSKSPQARQAAKEASDSADAAKKAAEQGDAKSAQQNDQRAADKLAEASKADGPQNPKSSGEKAASEARERAKDLKQAAGEARKLQEKTKSDAPQVSESAKKAAEALERAAQAEESAAKSMEKNGGVQSASEAESSQKEAQQRIAEAQRQLENANSGGDPSGTGHRLPSQVIRDFQASRTAPTQNRSAELLEKAAEELASGEPDTEKPDPAQPDATQQTATGNPPDSTNRVPPATPTASELPPAVKDIGIAPSDWARLPPNVQNQLLRAAQQPGPPEYREQIKNYFSRIARLQQEEAGGGAK